jgi:transcription elongation factor Elf1
MPPENSDDTRAIRKWCPLCGEWKESSATAKEEAADREGMVYCQDCGAKLRESE